MVGSWAGTPRRLALGFVLLLILPAAAVVLLGIQLLAQDRQLAAAQERDRQQVVADRVAGELEKVVASIERQLAAPDTPSANPPGDDAVLVHMTPGEFQAFPRDRLLYVPAVAKGHGEPNDEFSAGEALEFRDGNPDAAARAYREIVRRAKSPTVRANALLRLGRASRQAGRLDEAVQAYEQLARLSAVNIVDTPADLIGRRAYAGMLAVLGKHAELQIAAESLNRDLLQARWRIDRGTFEAYINDVNRWLGVPVHEVTEREALSAAALWLWRERQRETLPSSGRHSLRLESRDFTLIWKSEQQRLAAMVAGPRFQQRELIGPVRARFEHTIDHIQLVTPTAQWRAGNSPDPSMVHMTSAETALPWNVSVKVRDDTTATARALLRRRLFWAGVALLLLVVAAAAYVTGRSISRELAIARLQSDFVSAVSHEFRTPLTALKQFTDLLGDDDDLPPAKRRAFYQAQARATSRLTHLVESLLDFGRMEAGAHPYRMMPLAVGDVVSEVVAEFRRDAAQTGFHVQYSADAACERIVGDHDAVARAVRNLLENAQKYSGAGRNIHVRVERRHKATAISVRDEGLGIPLREQREIFKKFVRGSASQTLGIRGTGIGLAMVRHIVRAHRGRVIVQSEPGHGSTFTIVLPANVVGLTAVLDNRTIPSGL